MTVSATKNVQTSAPGILSRGASTNSASYGNSHTATSHSHHATGLDRYRATTEPSSRKMSPVQQGDAARAADAAKNAAKTSGAKSSATTPPPHHPIQVSSTVETRADGVRVSTVCIDVRANFRVEGGALRGGQSAETRARIIERAIERDFSATYQNADGTITRYVTDVRMSVGKPETADRTQFVYVAGSDTRLGGGVGVAPGFEKGNTAFVGDNGLARTAPHEFGHLAGLRHTAQFNLGCVTAAGTSINNLMSQSACSTSQQIERSQLQQIFKTPAFR